MTPIASVTRRHIQVRGVVQGVGFRPFVYKLAESASLTGHVFNTSVGITIEVEGPSFALDHFVAKLRASPPPLAEIGSILVQEIDPVGDLTFSILHSHREPGEFALISPDCATCDACRDEVSSPGNRRFGYPFTNCTHCGPRYTIVRDIPYDRALTTMAPFVMCAACAAEYADPNDRRFHAQPNACEVCGPSLALLGRGETLAADAFGRRSGLETIAEVRALLREGKIVAVRGLGGFLLACDAGNEAAVAELRRRKRRPMKPFALMARDLVSARRICNPSADDEAALLSPRRPIVLMPRHPGATLAPSVAPGNPTVGVMLPYTPLHALLFSDSPESISGPSTLVMTSGNLSEEPIVVSNEEALNQLSGIADCFLLHNRDIFTRLDDSVVCTFEGRERVLRRSRGYAPQTIDLGVEVSEVLAFGGELKNTFCLTKGRYAILSQHIGDLENYETEQFFAETLARMQHVFKAAPAAVAHDLHPDYRSTRMALAYPVERWFAIQHHHAHVASCMAENHLCGEVIGVAFDGTGYGSDGTIWGGEFLVGGLTSFTRAAHLRTVPLPGGDAAVRQPWRMALSYVLDAFGPQMPLDLACLHAVGEVELKLVESMLLRRFNTVDTSSCGRLFDAVAALLGLATTVTFEGEAAIALENAAATGVEDHYVFNIVDGAPMQVDLRAMIAAIVHDVAAKRSTAEISARFHNTLSAAIVEVCCRIRARNELGRVCLSGGSFQNLHLLSRTVVELRRRGFEVYLHAKVPANDGGIALGQAVIANELLRQA